MKREKESIGFQMNGIIYIHKRDATTGDGGRKEEQNLKKRMLSQLPTIVELGGGESGATGHRGKGGKTL